MQSIKSLRIRRIRYALALFLLGTLCSSEYGQTPGQQVQSGNEVTFHLNGGKNSPPVKIVHLMLGQTEIPLDSPVHVEGMWMPKISVVVQNISPKTIVKGGVMFSFPEAIAVANNRPVYGLVMSLGQPPKRAYIRRDGTIPPYNAPLQPQIRIAPGASMTFTPFPDANQVQATAYELAGKITKANINFDTIYFEDDSKWVAGQYYIAVPPPVVWQSVTPAEFFGTTTPTQR
jgi:hypothetical protein